MSTEQIVKFQPDRTLYLRGVDGAGAAAALHQTTRTGFSVSGVFRDMADFCVLVIYDADNTFEHYSIRYLPDFDLSGMTLTFDYTSAGLQPIDSVKYSWIDWGILDLITEDEVTLQVPLFPLATLKSGNFTAASTTFTLAAPGGANIYDRVTLFVNNAGFDFISYAGGDSAASVAANLAYQVNTHQWSNFADASVSVIANVSGASVTLINSQTGRVLTSGATVTWISGQTFVGLSSGMQFCLSGFFYTIATVISATQLTLTASPDSSSGGSSNGSAVNYTAPRGGLDGNSLVAYLIVRSANIRLTADKTVMPFSGGNSDGLTWTVSIDFSTVTGLNQASQDYYPINKIRQAWLTFAPQLPAHSVYIDTEWSVDISNWLTTDANGIEKLQIAGPDSLRFGNTDAACSYSTDDWTVLSQNNYWHGFAKQSTAIDSTVTITYSSTQAHDLYLGTSLRNDAGTVSVALDGVMVQASLNCYLKVDSELVTRRIIANNVSSGDHTVVITHTGAGKFIFDYLEAAVPTPDITDADISYSNISPALDFDTDATYKMSPQRLFWQITKLGFFGHMNEYLGVFWWNQRVRAGATWKSVVVTVAGTWNEGDSAELSIGLGEDTSSYFHMYKSVVASDTIDTIANHFVYYINSSAVAIWAAKTGSGQLTIYPRTPNWSENVVAYAVSSTGTFSAPASAAVGGTPGHWQVDPSAANPLNFAVRHWHSDLFNLVKAADMLITASFSMELVYPPDDGTIQNAWQARFYDGTPVNTDTGFASLVSSQCAFISNMTAFQQKVYLAMAALQSAAGLTPWLQFGEFLWWFFASSSFTVQSVTGTQPITIGLKDSHLMSTGDRVIITGVSGCTAANGTWPITVINATSFTIPVIANGSWTSGTGSVRGGSMAYYDAVTSAAAQTQLGRPLFKFTCQDDDPTVNAGEDTAFLAGRLKAHTDAITSAVLAQYPDAKFEVLYPNDVNHPVCLLGPAVPYAQGGKLNAAVNLPPQWLTKAGSGLDSFKVEALSWSASYTDMDRAQESIVFALTGTMSWDTDSVAYLVPWFNGTCPWPREFLYAFSRGLNIVNFWAYDHMSLMSWPLPLPISMESSRFLG